MHTLLAGTDGAAFLEIKEGPYDRRPPWSFAPWAPAEGHASVPTFQRWLRAVQPGSPAFESGTSDSK